MKRKKESTGYIYAKTKIPLNDLIKEGAHIILLCDEAESKRLLNKVSSYVARHKKKMCSTSKVTISKGSGKVGHEIHITGKAGA